MIIDLRSDTLSLPTDEMLASIRAAPLGDDSRDGDPTVQELEALTAEILGKEAALLTVSGTMSNVVAMRTHADPGGAALVEQSAHLYTTEFGGIAAACGLLVMPVAGRRGAIVPEALQDAVRRASAGFPARGLLCLENTHNAAGGTAIAPAHLDRCADIARAHGLAVHLDGARLFNAAVALHVTPSDIARAADSVSVCLSKGLSAPVGSLLAGSDQFVARARRVRRMFGGAMRQAGIIAAPGLVALRTMVSRLTEDHAHAAALGHALARIAGLTIDLESVQTNMVLVDVSRLGIDASTFARHLDPRGVRGLPGMGSTIRFVTYRGITRADVDDVARIVAETVAAAPWLSETVNV